MNGFLLFLTVPTISWCIIPIAIVAIIATFAAIQEGYYIGSQSARKKRIMKADFVKAMETSGIAPKVFENMVSKYQKLLPMFNEVIDMSFLDEEDKEMYKQSIASRLKRLIAEKKDV